MAKLLISRHVHICRRSENVVILDMRSGKYFGLGRAATRELAAWVADWPADEAAEARGESERDSSAAGGRPPEVLQRLLSQGFLTTDPRAGKSATPVRVTPGSKDMTLEAGLTREPVQVHHLWNFAIAALCAALLLRMRSIDAIVRRAQRRRVIRHGAPDLERSKRLVAVYFRLRPLVFTAKDECLFDALALLSFLARYGEAATWVFGVRTSPFAAHCWLQQQEVVLNDDVDHVRRYTPIVAA